MKKNFLVISSRFGFSGVPLAQYKLAYALSKKGFNVDLVYGFAEKKIILKKNKFLNIFHFNKKRVIFLIFDLIKYIIKNKPDVIFSAGDHLNVIVLFCCIISGSNCKVCCSSRVTPFDTYKNGFFKKGWILKLLYYNFMYRATVLSCVSYDMVKQYKIFFPKNKFVPIYNIAINFDNFRQKTHENINKKFKKNSNETNFIFAGMLEEWKNVDILIKSFSEFTKIYKSKLLILGDGSKKKQLNQLVKKLSISNKVFFLGNVRNPYKYFNNSNIFVLPSRVEGLPNVLIEAMACGCTIVSTNCPTGPREILQNGKYGYLCKVNDQKDMLNKMILARKKPLSVLELNKAIKPFLPEIIIQKYFKLLKFNK